MFTCLEGQQQSAQLLEEYQETRHPDLTIC